MHLQNLGNSINAINELQNVFENISNMNRISTAEMSALTFVTSDYSDEILKLATSQMALTKEQATVIFTAKGLSGAELDAAIKTATHSATQKEATASTGGLSTAYKGLAASIGVSTTALTAMLGVLATVYRKRAIDLICQLLFLCILVHILNLKGCG